MLRQLGDALERGVQALALELERLGDHRYGEDAQLTGDLCHHRRGAGAGAAAHASGDKQHVGAGNGLDDAFAVLECGAASDLRTCPRAQALGELRTDADLRRRQGAQQRLLVGVGANELDALHTAVDHVVDCIAAATTHSDDFDDGALTGRFHDLEHDAVTSSRNCLAPKCERAPRPSAVARP